ncbi:MFS general substrate transporter [Coniochaeta ligniaria NRRL 30616]|uniref:MFS general substrate transporter n=1 Tax=Coniochaeta ligniaria NRRL 30616 TaxID=1408157 RepID=A0A1J7IK29_9PEZI|nr:MFS general substrate transporter [Coniochaeta ligniaria NRRL 30616]
MVSRPIPSWPRSIDGRKPKSEWKPGKQEYAVMVTIAVVSLMVALDATILVPVLPTLAVDLGGTTSEAFWAGTSYLLTCAVFQPFIAAMLLLSITFFFLGTLLCAPLAHSFTVLLAGRSLQGIGGGGIIAMGQVIFADIIPLRQRPNYFSIVLAAWALGTVLGPLIGGVFVERATWRWCFYINFPFCALGFIMVPLFVKLETEKSSFVSKLTRIDWIGAFLFIGGTASFLIGLSWAGIQYEWASVQTLAPIFVGINAVTAAIAWEIFYAKEPFIRPRLFSSPSSLAAYACAFLQGFSLFCRLYYVPFYFTAAKFHRPIQSGLGLLPVSILFLPGSVIVGFLTARLGRFRWALWAGWAITALGGGLFLLFDVDTPTPAWAAILCVFGIGNGMILTSINVAIQAISKAEDCGRAAAIMASVAAMYVFMRSLGMSIGVAVGGTTFQNVMSHKLHKLGIPDAIAKNAEAFVHELWELPPTDPVRVGALQAYVQGFHGVFWVITGTTLAGLVISLFIRHHSMDKPLESNFVLQGGAGLRFRKANLATLRRLQRHCPSSLLGSVKKAAIHQMLSNTVSIDSLKRLSRP